MAHTKEQYVTSTLITIWMNIHFASIGEIPKHEVFYFTASWNKLLKFRP